MKSLTIFSLFVLLIFTECKKDKDIVATKNINGAVYNNCNDSGLANVTVFLQDGQGLNISTVSGSDGSFSFSNVKIHSDSKFDYVIYIPSKSGTNATTFENCGFDGTRLYFSHEQTDLFFKPRVTPRYLTFDVYCNKTVPTDSNDYIMFTCTNYIFHKNVQDYPFKWSGGGYGAPKGQFNTANYFNGSGGYPMGKYIIDIDIWKNNIHTTKRDSAYLTWGANSSYTINW